MLRTRQGLSVALLFALPFVAACEKGPSPEELEREAEWTWISDAKAQLDAKRQELAALREQLAALAGAEPAAGGAEGEEVAGPTAEELSAQVEQLQTEVADLSEEFNGRLVGALNADPMIEGEEPTERQQAMLRMKSDEDMLMAAEWIDKGGDYKRAIEIYNTALGLDPDNEKLKQALARAEADRFMSRERFEQAKKGMTEDEVRALLGQANLRNVKQYPDDVVGWFYPTADDGSAAAVWFKPDKKRDARVAYQLKYEAIKPGGEEAGA